MPASALVLRLGIAAAVAVFAACEAIEPPATPHPILHTLTERVGDTVALVEPDQLVGLAIGRDEAVRLALRKMSSDTADGPTVAWGVEVATPAGRRFGWIVVRGDPRDPSMEGSVFAIEVVVIDGTSGQPIEWQGRRFDLPHGAP